MIYARRLVLLPAILGLAACVSNTARMSGGEVPLIARGTDSAAHNTDALQEGHAAIVIDPDGCQAWWIDNGIEGYSVNRIDPVTGRPVCSEEIPPGTVIGQFRNTDLPDYLP